MNAMRLLLPILMTTVLAACGGGSGGGGVAAAPPETGDAACSLTGQKEFVLTAMNDWYLWNDLLPATVDIDSYETPESLLAYLTSFQPVDTFSFIGSAAADQQFFGEGRYEGFGFSSRFVASDDLRLSRVFVDSPAYPAGLRRGQRIVAMNGRTIAEIQAAEGVNAVLGLDTVEFTMREIDGSEFTATITRDIVTIDPVPQYRIIEASGGRRIGYLELATFISTANNQLDEAFAAFKAASVSELILDLRYNGGGLVSTSELLGDLLGGFYATGEIFSKTVYNADRSSSNSIETFEFRDASINLSSLVVITTPATASASELVTNSMFPHTRVALVGQRTFGKPVGQVGFEFCEKILRPTAFKTVNSLDEGDYFGGLPVDCPADDDLDVPVGDDNDPNVVAALQFLETQSCPASGASVADAQFKLAGGDIPVTDRGRFGPPHRAFLDAW